MFENNNYDSTIIGSRDYRQPAHLSGSNLFQKVVWWKIEAELILEIPTESLITNVNIVPFINNESVVIRFENGDWEIPGGELKKDGNYHEH